MTSGSFRPSLFFLTGLAWLILASLLGIGLFFGMVLASTLPPFLRSLHVHGALVGGVGQLMLGTMLAYLPSVGPAKQQPPNTTSPFLFLSFNGGTVGLLMGLSWNLHLLIGIAGLFIILPFLVLLIQGIAKAQGQPGGVPGSLWGYGVVLIVLLAGLGVGEAMAFRVVSLQQLGYARLAHIHLNILGFVTLVIVGTMHHFFPTILNSRLHSPMLGRMTLVFIPGGILTLIVGFMVSNLWVQIAAGGLLLAGTLVYAYNIFRTWMVAGQPKSIASDHLIVATVFLVLSIVTGTLISVNSLSHPPKFPFGTIHLMAYTHLALIGFILQSIFGAFSYILPTTLATARVSNETKRQPYLEKLKQTVERWRGLQVTTLTLGTLGLAVVATLLWQFPLYSEQVKYATWTTIGLLLMGFILFSIKIGILVGQRPSD